jgi:hypothetical protein
MSFGPNSFLYSSAISDMEICVRTRSHSRTGLNRSHAVEMHIDDYIEMRIDATPLSCANSLPGSRRTFFAMWKLHRARCFHPLRFGG